MAELAEQVEGVLAAETAPASGVRLGRRIAAQLTAEEARDANQSWLEGCLWASARASGLEWDRWRCVAAAQVLRTQERGWERAVAQAIGGADSDASGSVESG